MTALHLIGGIPWRGGPQLPDEIEEQYRAEQADYDPGEDEL